VEATQPWAPATAGGSLGKLIDLQERELRDLFERVAKQAGEPILAARDVADLARLIDHVLTFPDVYEISTRAMRASTVAELTEPPSEPRAEVVDTLGATAAAHLYNGLRLWQLAMAEFVRILTNLSDDERALAVAAMDAHAGDPLGFVYEPSMPLALREALLDCMRGLPATLAIAHAVGTKQRLTPWLSLELASILERGQRALLRYVACLPGAAVSEAVLPKEERLDELELARQHDAALLRTEEWATLAEASGREVYVAGSK